LYVWWVRTSGAATTSLPGRSRPLTGFGRAWSRKARRNLIWAWWWPRPTWDAR